MVLAARVEKASISQALEISVRKGPGRNSVYPHLWPEGPGEGFGEGIETSLRRAVGLGVGRRLKGRNGRDIDDTASIPGSHVRASPGHEAEGPFRFTPTTLSKSASETDSRSG